MNARTFISASALAILLAASTSVAVAQQSSYEELRARNASMASLQPAWSTPVVASDPRLVQYVRMSVSHGYAAAGNATVNYGNGRGFGLVGWNRVEFDYAPPAYIQHNSTAVDGLGDTSVSAKLRIASGGPEYGNFALTAFLSHTFATGTYKNGALTDTWSPMLGGGLIRKRFAFVCTLGGTLPTGKIVTQGRSIVWNSLAQHHVTNHLTLEVENNASFYSAGANNGKMQNFLTPAAYYLLRRRHWSPTRSFFVFATGMQIATSQFHSCNHNFIGEVRYLF